METKELPWDNGRPGPDPTLGLPSPLADTSRSFQSDYFIIIIVIIIVHGIMRGWALILGRVSLLIMTLSSHRHQMFVGNFFMDVFKMESLSLPDSLK